MPMNCTLQGFSNRRASSWGICILWKNGVWARELDDVDGVKLSCLSSSMRTDTQHHHRKTDKEPNSMRSTEASGCINVWRLDRELNSLAYQVMEINIKMIFSQTRLWTAEGQCHLHWLHKNTFQRTSLAGTVTLNNWTPLPTCCTSLEAKQHSVQSRLQWDGAIDYPGWDELPRKLLWGHPLLSTCELIIKFSWESEKLCKVKIYS